MAGDVQVQNLPPIVANNKEAVQQLERYRRDRKEIHGSDRFAMIAKKGQPASGKFWISGRSLHPTGDAALRHIETEHEQFAVDAGSTPGGVLSHHPEDPALRSRSSFYQPARFPSRSGSSTSENLRDASAPPF